MPLLLQHAHVFSPDDCGIQDLLIVHDRIVAMSPKLDVKIPDLEVVDLSHKIVTPGLIDQHVHVTGGGGEGGPATRTPEIQLSELIHAGTTAVVGVSGTDFTTRSIENLLAKVRALNTEGVRSWMYTSNYHYPPTTLTGSVPQDLFCVPEVLGCKIAIGDHRSSFPTDDEVLRLLSDIRVGAMISGKLGVLHIHSGNIPGAFDLYHRLVDKGFPIMHIRPTHCARIEHVFEDAITFAKRGGMVDFTTGGSCCFGHPANAVLEALNRGVDPDRITLSTDGHGSIPRFNALGVMVGLGVGGVNTNLDTLQVLIREHKMDPSLALRFVTTSVAQGLRLDHQIGRVKPGLDASLCIFEKDWTLTDVMSLGAWMMRDGQLKKVGTFEDPI